MLHFRGCSATISDTTLANSSIGGLSVSDAHIAIADSKFVENNPRLKKYPSLRRNMLCNANRSLHVSSLKGGDGSQNDSSLWVLNSGCILSGIPSARLSPLFVPSLFSVTSSSSANQTTLIFTGFLLLPCNLTFQLISKVGNLEMTQNEEFSQDGYVSENEVHAMIDSSFLNNAGDEAEVSVRILFGSTDSPSQTEASILKNKTDSKIDDEAKVAKGANGSTPSLSLIIIVLFAVLFLIVLVVSIAFIVRWRKQKKRTEELELIVEDTVKKDPKLIEMVTMEMSPEEQWRKAEREVEKKNNERIEKRVYAKSLGHSESSEHLLSESCSTEYILGKDSDKIPDWALEKVEEEEIRKQTPSPSISSTSSTSTTDSDSTLVRSESLCPTTSSMSNLVDAMACSSPHEKLIVDLRDSLFMQVRGRNKTNEMPISSLEEREVTATQILFWVANGALHSFDEMENPLSSLANLSQHIVLFSEHMVICIVMHSDFLLSDDSDSSSISSSTVVTSASDDDDDDSDSLPSSAFEDEDDFRKECLRWKAPELLTNKKMGATKESVSFSIGIMLWECLTLQIPFGEYDPETAGQKIINVERMCLNSIHQSSLAAVATKCVASQWRDRPGLDQLKREFIQHFPPGAAILTMSDAVACAPASRCASGYETNGTLDACLGN
ncbi:uncharacterized protein MONOS_15459 [Monocercomonoides exilis]|uniref:uncharacterized protein n=1 Tax=Monocercomonoides exilis TaxID=2049356 RepID=UPI0035594FEB|nr:hypothetical protein MONOS_15459 [Monocercomonoides exilis]|eukprot:MONOS_15459.1-p1 / transcript=MONOS_15459.1 / gene=MONOS_15459 / organism=Monocercomonoides_exilis_PA203 / gene_product=unspecified product / transcript_product=unspecified product / location=Mono_scaffold01238:7874-9874(+) / protein_length=666 / sequence_SO=supercontig / SO=protein_coding / is_pseudo=false